jgi:hypothetical protein
LQSLESQGYETPSEYRGGRKKKDSNPFAQGIFNNYAEGGDVQDDRFCSRAHAHLPDCEYYLAGGDIIPPDQVQVDQEPIDPSQVKIDSPDEIPNDQVQLDSDKYSTLPQQIGTAAEGVAKGLAGPIATGAELAAHEVGLDKAFGMDTSAEAQKGRAEENPLISGISEGTGLVGGLVSGEGLPGLVAKSVEAIPMIGKLAEATTIGGQILSKAATAGIENMAFQASDEGTKAMLGMGNPDHPVSSALFNVGASGLFGLGAGGLFGAVGSGAAKGLEAIDNAKLAAKLDSYMAGVGYAASEEDPAKRAAIKEALFGGKPKLKFGQSGTMLDSAEDVAAQHEAVGKTFDPTAFKMGFGHIDSGALQDKLVNSTASALTAAGAAATGTGIFGYAFAKKEVAKMLGKYADKYLTPTAEKYTYPVILKAIQTGSFDNLVGQLRYAKNASMGARAITKSIDALFDGTKIATQQTGDKTRAGEKLMDFISSGGMNRDVINPQEVVPDENQTPAFAQGGDVQPQASDPNPLAKIYPDQNVLVNAARMRVSNYLTTVKPTQSMKMPFDTSQKDPAKERSYMRAINIANDPMSVLEHIQNGEFTAEHVQHMTGMYPDLHNHLSKEITKKITESQLGETKPSYKVRQGLSLFLGSALDSSMTPASIQAAQGVFAQQNAEKQAGMAAGKPKRGTGTMSKIAQKYQTDDQARVDRLNKS